MTDTDHHAHVVEDSAHFPLWSGRSYDPPLAPLEKYLALLDALGLEHGVLVQPSVYGYDNRCLLDALDRARGRLQGIVVPAPGTSAQELEAMHNRGARGVRCNLLLPGGLSLNEVRGWTPVMRELGWQVQLHISIDRSDPQPFVELGVPVVIDHMGRPESNAGEQRIIDLIRAAECYVKLSAPYRVPGAHDLALALLEADRTRCLWGSDWPHTETKTPPTIDDLRATLRAWS